MQNADLGTFEAITDLLVSTSLSCHVRWPTSYHGALSVGPEGVPHRRYGDSIPISCSLIQEGNIGETRNRPAHPRSLVVCV